MRLVGISVPLAVIFAACSTTGCAASHMSGDDAGIDAGGALFDGGPGDAFVVADADAPDGLAPRCPTVPSPPCLALVSQATFATGDRDVDGTLHAMAYATAPAILFNYVSEETVDPPVSPSRWAVQSITASGALDGSPLFLDEMYDQSSSWGADLNVVDGVLVAGWRQGRFDTSYTPPAWIGADTFVGAVSVGPRVGPIHSVEGSFTTQGPDVAVAAGLVITGSQAGLLVSRVDGLGVPLVVETEHPQEYEIAAAALGPHRALLVWSEHHALSGFATEAAIVSDTAVEARIRVFEPAVNGLNARAVAIGDELWIARYDTDRAHLRESRIRVAHLDASLRRIGADRWFGGWGGLTPAGLSLVVWHGIPWLVWRTLDARYGANTVLYARPIPEPECGYDVSDPAAVWRPGTLEGPLLAVASDSAIWVTVPQVSGHGTADVYQFRACE